MGGKDELQLIKMARVEPGKKVDLKNHPSSWKDPDKFSIDGMRLSKENSDELLTISQKRLAKMQEVLWADDRFSILIILQGMDTSGKDGIIEHVMAGVNPQGCEVTSFKTPTAEEVSHDFLWRCVKVLPEKGRIGIFNRSYYEEVVVVRVHPNFLGNQMLPVKEFDYKFWDTRYESINALESHLERSGTRVIKFFLYVSKEEQRNRLLARMDEAEKRWKFNPGDVQERDLWPKYMDAYRRALEATSTDRSPWYVLPADQKWLSRVLAALIITSEIEKLGLRYPELSEEDQKAMAEARAKLTKND
ncbi:MAG: polyphosphate kinase 2 family protein [Methanomassiliicoccales archaeon]|nr:polyphosphate kinase 2 family protein [Methanomassiliicoccales archaeon]